MDRRLKHTDTASTYHYHHVQPTADDAYDAAGEHAPRPRTRVTLPVAMMASMLLIASLAAGACYPTGAWAVEPAGPGQETGDSNSGSRPGDGGQASGADQNGSAGGSAGSQTGNGSSGSTGSNGNAGGNAGSAGGGESTVPTPAPTPTPSQPTWTGYKIYLYWGPVLGNATGIVDVPAGGTAQAVEGKAVAGYKFDGWASDAGCTVPFDWSAPVWLDQSAWACYEKTAPAYSVSDLSGVTVNVDGVKRALSPGTTTTVGHGARIRLAGVPSGWTTSKSTVEGIEKITVTSPDGAVTASWSFRRKPAGDGAGSKGSSETGVEPRAKAKADGKHDGSRTGDDEPALLTVRQHDGDKRQPISSKTIILAAVTAVGTAVVAACLTRLRRLGTMGSGDDAYSPAAPVDGERRGGGANLIARHRAAADSADRRLTSSEAETQVMSPPAGASAPVTVDSAGTLDLSDLVRRTTGALELEAAGVDGVESSRRTETVAIADPLETLDHRH